MVERYFQRFLLLVNSRRFRIAWDVLGSMVRQPPRYIRLKSGSNILQTLGTQISAWVKTGFLCVFEDRNKSRYIVRAQTDKHSSLIRTLIMSRAFLPCPRIGVAKRGTPRLVTKRFLLQYCTPILPPGKIYRVKGLRGRIASGSARAGRKKGRTRWSRASRKAVH